MSEILTEDELRDLTLSELLKLGAKLQYREPTEEEKKGRILIMDVVLPGAIHDVDIKVKFQDE